MIIALTISKIYYLIKSIYHRGETLKFIQSISNLLITFIFISFMFAKTNIIGTITDEFNNPLIGVNVYIENYFIGTATDSEGKFVLETELNKPFNLIVSYMGYSTKNIIINNDKTNFNIVMKQKNFMADDVVVSASRVKESYMKAPVSIEKIDASDIRKTPSVGFYESLDNLRDIELRRNSILNQSVTGRGYGTTYNSNLVQIVDGANNAPVTNGSFSIGNLLGIPEIDIANIEFMPGASSALYGANAYSGIMFINSKTPHFYRGLSFNLKGGMTNNQGEKSNLYKDYSVRFAHGNNNLAYKLVFEQISGYDWKRDDFSNPVFSGYSIPYMQINNYGDEIGQVIGGIPVYRTGYKDSELMDYKISNLKFSTAFEYNLTKSTKLSYTYRNAIGTSNFQGTSIYSFKDLRGIYNQLKLKGKNYQIQANVFSENGGDSYNVSFAAINLNRSFKADAIWGADYLAVFTGQLEVYKDEELQNLFEPQNDQDARDFADYGGYILGNDNNGTNDFIISTIDTNSSPRLDPDTDDFKKALNNVIKTKNFTTGAGFESESKIYDIDGYYEFKNNYGFENIVLGASYKMYRPITNGSIFSDDDEINDRMGFIKVDEYAIFTQFSKNFTNKLNFQTSLRFDGHSNFKSRISPRISLVYDLSKKQHMRLSYQLGFANPTVQEQFNYLDVGIYKLTGGSKKNAERLGIEHIYTDGIIQNEDGTYSFQKTAYAQAESQISYELGYKALFYDNLFMDLNYYASTYNNPLDVKNVYDPEDCNDIGAGPDQMISTADDTAIDCNGTVPYRLGVNREGKDKLHGAGFTFAYNFLYNFKIQVSYSYVDLNMKSNEAYRPITQRPKNRAKFSLSNPNLVRNIGFSIAMRYSDSYFQNQEGGFGEGEINSSTILDAQISYKIPKFFMSTLKLGANNLTGKDYIQSIGGPNIGRTIYLSISFDQMLNN